MSATEPLLRTAKLMRERAEGATPGPWAWEATGEKDNSWAVGLVQDEAEHTLSGQIAAGEGIVIDGVCEGIGGRLPDAAHVAGMHPGVAMAVADLLEELAEHAAHNSQGALVLGGLDVARAYLGVTA